MATKVKTTGKGKVETKTTPKTAEKVSKKEVPAKKAKKEEKTEVKTTASKIVRKVGDTKVGSDGIKRVWTKLPSGNFDWRRVKTEDKK